VTVQLSKEEETLVESVRQLGLSPAKVNRLLAGLNSNALVETSRQEKNKGSLSIDDDLAGVYSNAYRRALAVALERKALIDSGLLSEEKTHTHNGLDVILEALKTRPQSEKLSVSDLTMLILASNLGGNKAEGGISLRDLLPLLQKGGQLSVSDVVALLERAKPPPSAPPMPQANTSGLGDIFDESIKQILRDKIVEALKSETKRGPSADWGGIASRIIDTIRDVTGKIPPPQAPPPETISGEPIPLAAESLPSEAVTAPSLEASAASPSVSSETPILPEQSAKIAPATTSSTTEKELGGIEG
jgi:hypothetical protein